MQRFFVSGGQSYWSMSRPLWKRPSAMLSRAPGVRLSVAWRAELFAFPRGKQSRAHVHGGSQGPGDRHRRPRRACDSQLRVSCRPRPHGAFRSLHPHLRWGVFIQLVWEEDRRGKRANSQLNCEGVLSRAHVVRQNSLTLYIATKKSKGFWFYFSLSMVSLTLELNRGSLSMTSCITSKHVHSTNHILPYWGSSVRWSSRNNI